MANAPEGTGGIVNVGFTCYANSTIQALRHYKNVENLLQEDTYTTILNTTTTF